MLEFAERRLRLAGDADSAVVALQLADDKLRALYAPALATVRAQIATDIAALEAMPTVDTVGTLSALSVLAHSVYNLPPAGDFSATVVTDEPAKRATERRFIAMGRRQKYSRRPR